MTFTHRVSCTSVQKILISIYQNLGTTCKYIFWERDANEKARVIMLVHCFSFKTEGSNIYKIIKDFDSVYTIYKNLIRQLSLLFYLNSTYKALTTCQALTMC